MNEEAGEDRQAATGQDSEKQPPKSLNAVQRRILGALIEKARTTPDAYPLSLNGLVTACNQKSNRSPLMNLTHEQVADELIVLRDKGIVAEVHGGGRVPKYRHYGYDYLGVKGVEAGVMTELLLRGEQTVGDLRTRASRFEPITDVNALLAILNELERRQLVVPLTPPGRGQIYTHNLYEPGELEAIKSRVSSGELAQPGRTASTSPAGEDLELLRQQLAELKTTVEDLAERVSRLEG